MQPSDRLDELMKAPKIPTLPAAAIRVLEKVGSPDCTLDAVGEIIRQDPSLCGLVVKTLNSALYAFSRPVVSVDKALVMLGLTRIRSLILTLYLPTIRSGTPISPRLSKFWQSSVIGAIIMRELSAQSSQRDPEQDLLASLMRDLGQLIMSQGGGGQYEAILVAHEGAPHGDVVGAEKATFGFSHADVTGELLRRWRLPESLWKAIAFHHEPNLAEAESAETRVRSKMLNFASITTDLLLHPNVPGLKAKVLHAADDVFGMDEEDLANFLAPLNEKVASMASFLNVDMGTNENFATILSTASSELVRLAMESSLETLREQASVQRAEAEAAAWRERATRDSLTGLFNRSHLVTSLDEAIVRARRNQSGVGVLFIDLDGFKPINDRFGHSAGDTVLREVGAHLRGNVRNEDLVARFGGDEFCVLLSDTAEDGAKLVGERIVRVLNELPLVFNGESCRIGASVGATVALPWIAPATSQQMLDAADRAMYAAKRAGKNRVAVESLLVERDRKAMDEVRQRTFRDYLVRTKHIGDHWLDDALTRRLPRPCLQRIARRLGWLSREEAIRLSRAQRIDGQLFEEAARSRRLLDQHQIWSIIACRIDPPEYIARRLAKSGALSESDARRALTDYYESLGARPTHSTRRGRLPVSVGR